MASSKEHKEAEDVVATTPKKDKKEKKEKKDKKEKKEKKEKKRSETDGVHKSKDKSDKKEKHKKEKLARALENHLQESAAASVAAEEKAKEAKEAKEADDKDMPDADVPAKQRGPKPIIRGALVEFARPLAADKYQKKVLKIVKRAAKQQALLRGVKEVNKALRKATPKNPAAKDDGNVPGVVVIAGDVNPAEVIMHLPLACEDVSAPYVFVVSRGELGQAARTKRPTSVVMVKAEGRAAKKGAAAAKKADDEDDEDDEDSGSYADQYKEFVQLVQKEYVRQMKGLI